MNVQYYPKMELKKKTEPIFFDTHVDYGIGLDKSVYRFINTRALQRTIFPYDLFLRDCPTLKQKARIIGPDGDLFRIGILGVGPQGSGSRIYDFIEYMKTWKYRTADIPLVQTTVEIRVNIEVTCLNRRYKENLRNNFRKQVSVSKALRDRLSQKRRGSTSKSRRKNKKKR